MTRSSGKRLLASCSADDFVGRGNEFARLLAHATESVGGLVLLEEPSSGASELLRRTYDELFFTQTEVIPFYFEIKPSDGNVRYLSQRFVREFLRQTVAFRRQTPYMIAAAPDLDEIAELAMPSDGHWIDRLVEAFRGGNSVGNDRSFARDAFSAPLRAVGHGERCFVIIDGLQNVADIENGERLLDDISDIFRRAATPFVLCGHRRALFANTPFKAMRLDRLDPKETAKIVEVLAKNAGVKLNDQTRDLIAVQTTSDLLSIRDILMTAAENGISLDGFEKVEQVYTDEIFGGRIARRLDAIYRRVVPKAGRRRAVIDILAETMRSTERSTPLSHWKKKLGLENSELRSILERLSSFEIVDVSSSSVDFDRSNIVFADHTIAGSNLALNEKPRGMLVGEALTSNIRRAPKLMARHYRKHSAIGLRELLEAFDGRSLSIAALDHGRFKALLQSADDEKALAVLTSDPDKIALPRIVFAAPASAFYRKLRELTDDERAAVALGFDGDGKEIAIIAAEIESKLEAEREKTEFWCDRLEMVAHNSGFKNFRLWLVAPEGFDEDAMQALSERNAYGSSRRQVTLLSRLLDAKVANSARPGSEEYEIVVPMGDDTEIISARAVEDIAKRHNFSAKAINQIKTALVEACINATEHSMSPDRRIHQKFVVDDEKLEITIANRGIRLTDHIPDTPAEEKRRGWGLKLMRSLMDDVRVERTDDGTRLTLIKFLDIGQKPAE